MTQRRASSRESSRDGVISRLRETNYSYDTLSLPRKIEVKSIVPNSTPSMQYNGTPVRRTITPPPTKEGRELKFNARTEPPTGSVVYFQSNAEVEVNSGTLSSPDWGRAVVINDGPHGIVVRWEDGSAQRFSSRCSVRAASR